VECGDLVGKTSKIGSLQRLVRRSGEVEAVRRLQPVAVDDRDRGRRVDTCAPTRDDTHRREPLLEETTEAIAREGAAEADRYAKARKCDGCVERPAAWKQAEHVTVVVCIDQRPTTAITRTVQASRDVF